MSACCTMDCFAFARNDGELTTERHACRYSRTPSVRFDLLDSVVRRLRRRHALPDAIAAPGETIVAHPARRRRAGLRMQGRHRRQARLGVPRADRDAAARRQDRRPALRRAELGAHRRQRGGRQGGRQRTRCDAERHSLAEARRDVAGAATASSPASRRCSGSTRAVASSTAPATSPAPTGARPTPRTTYSCARAKARAIMAAHIGARQSMIRGEWVPSFPGRVQTRSCLRARSCSSERMTAMTTLQEPSSTP